MAQVGDKNRFSRWRRLPPVFRSGEHRLPGYEDETQRLTLYLPGSLLDLAQTLADMDDGSTIQDYCSQLLAQALEHERIRKRVAAVESKRGPLKGLDEIAEDASYLAEWKDRNLPAPAGDPTPSGEVTIPLVHIPPLDDADSPDGPADARPLTVHIESGPRREPIVADRLIPEIIDGRPMDILWKHVGPDGGDPSGFLPRLRRGESIPAPIAAELIEALRRLDDQNRGEAGLERKLAYALYRLALESQVLLTEAWPGAFDEPTVAAIRSVQGMVERILSGESDRRQPGGGS